MLCAVLCHLVYLYNLFTDGTTKGKVIVCYCMFNLHISALIALGFFPYLLCCSLTMLHSVFTVVHIASPTDIRALSHRSRSYPFHSNQELSISPIEPPTHILISGLPPGTPEFALKLYLEKLRTEAEHVELLPPNQAIVKFTTGDGKYMYTNGYT